MVENVIQIKSGITLNDDAGVRIWKNMICVKKILFGILLYIVAKIVNM